MKEFMEFLQFNWEQRSIFYDDGDVESRQQFLVPAEYMGLKTKGYIGTIAYKGHQFNIFPKVFRTHKGKDDLSSLDSKHLLHNLVKWLEYISKVDYPYINISSGLEASDNLLSLFISIYVRYVKAAMDNGLYYRYEDRIEDLPMVRGKLDIKDYITKKYPSGIHDKFRCEYSTYEFDNLLNRIIKCTLVMLYNNQKTSVENQKLIRGLLMKLGDVSDMRCVPHDCDKVQLNKMQNRYKIVLSMSKMFLLNRTTDYSIDTHDSFCFLFPANLLFEGFICGYLQHAFGCEANIKAQASDAYLVGSITLGDKQFGHAFEMRHDILLEYRDKIFILDTKYKMISRFADNSNFLHDITKEVSSGDLYQVVSYAVSRGVDKVFLLYPQCRNEEIEPYPAIMKKPVKIDDAEGCVEIYAVRLPFVFEEGDDSTKDNLKNVLLSLFQ
ncbi:MAG: McrC family protein [Clostridiales bacterium]|nr:McrC family protein [Clostridiales bacterium]